jgi:hypothetical protein
MARQQVRSAFASAVNSVFTDPVFSTRITDGREYSSFVMIHISGGSFTPLLNGTQFETRCDVYVSIYKNSATDEQLDVISESIIAAISNSADIKQYCKRPLPVSFEYDQQNDDYNGLTLIYSAIF